MPGNVIISTEQYGALNPVRFGYDDCSSSHSYGPAIRTHWLIHFVVSGFGIFRIENREYKISPGEMFIIPPFTETYYKADSEKPWSYIWLGFTASDSIPLALDDVIYCPQAYDIFNAMKSCTTMTTGISAFLCARIWDLFYMLLNRAKAQPDYIEKALNFIHSEYMNDITVKQIADFLNLNRVYFSTLFKERVGISPKQYLLNYRMHIATLMLSNNNASISVIANSVGYSDIYNFSKMFKQHYGVSPKKYTQHFPKKTAD